MANLGGKNMYEAFMSKIETILTPLGTKLGNQRHLKAISNGMMFALPCILYLGFLPSGFYCG
jgi:cellobiose-specific phosphotransferase system component IIC